MFRGWKQLRDKRRAQEELADKFDKKRLQKGFLLNYSLFTDLFISNTDNEKKYKNRIG